MSLADQKIWRELEGHIKCLILNKYNGLECMIYCHDVIMLQCYKILWRMLQSHGVYPEYSLTLIHQNYDQEDNSKIEKMIYCYFYVAYCYYFVKNKDMVQTRDAQEENPPSAVKRPVVAIITTSNAKGQSSPASKSPPAVDNQVIEDLHKKIQDLENMIKAFHVRVDGVEEDQKHIEPRKRIYDTIQNNRF